MKLLQLTALALSLAACRPQEAPAPLPTAPPCTSFAMIRWIGDSSGLRLAEVDTLQKLPAKPGEAAPEYANTVPGFTRWTIAPDARLTFHTLSVDSFGSFLFYESVGFDTLRAIFAPGASSRFHLMPFKIIHSDTTISSISEEYLP